MIEVNNLIKFYGDHKAVDNISFSVKDGTVCGFCGPNGAGKSTTMNIMTGCLSATSGNVTIGGYDIFDHPIEAKNLIGYLPEQPPLYLEETPREYLKFIAEAKKIPRKSIKEEIETVMEETQIKDVADRLIKNLSKGYKQRVGIAQTLLGNPKVIILDEPTVGLDPIQVVEIRDLIKSLGKKHTVILSSHILSEVSAVCDYVLIISHGKLVASDTPDNLGKLAAGSNNLNLLVKGEKSRIRQLLEEISGVKEISIEKKSDQEGWNVTVSTEENADIREEVFFKMAENHCPILEMQSQKISLEEIFLELTEDNKKDSSDTDNRIQTAEEAEAVIRESENMTEEADKHDSSL